MLSTTTPPTLTHDQFRRLERKVSRRTPKAEDNFEEYAEAYGVASALNSEVHGVRKAQGHDDYTNKIRDAVHEFIEETADGGFRITNLQNFKNAVKTQRDRIERDSIQNYNKTTVKNGERAYREGRLKALNTVEYCESLIKSLEE